MLFRCGTSTLSSRSSGIRVPTSCFSRSVNRGGKWHDAHRFCLLIGRPSLVVVRSKSSLPLRWAAVSSAPSGRW